MRAIVLTSTFGVGAFLIGWLGAYADAFVFALDEASARQLGSPEFAYVPILAARLVAMGIGSLIFGVSIFRVRMSGESRAVPALFWSTIWLFGINIMAILEQIIPVLTYQDIAAAHDFLVMAFGFSGGGVHRNAEGQAVHGEVRAGKATIWLHRVTAEHELDSPRVTDVADSGLFVYVDDVDAHYEQARTDARCYPFARLIRGR